MSRENVEWARKSFEAYVTGGVEAFLEFVAPDGVWYPAPEFIEAPEYRGHDGVRFLFSVFTDTFDDWTIDLVEVRDAGDSVVALAEHGGKIKGTDTPLRQPMGIVLSDFRQRPVQARRVHFFQTWREALEAAGLSE
jgi:ketosteroid isomerase-like protein